MIDFLYANGCSWTAGNGIEQDPSLTHLIEHERWARLPLFAWPKVLADNLRVNHKNDALGAASNKRMVRTTCEFLQNYTGDYSKLLVVLGWTSVDRSEIYLEEGDKKGWILFNSTQSVSSHGIYWLHGFSQGFIKDIDQWQKDYLVSVYSSYERSYTYFQEIYLMKNLLENLGVKYLFFNSLPWKHQAYTWLRTPMFNPEMEFRETIDKLKNPKILNLRDCDDSTNVMSLFCKKNNIPMAPDFHTMIEGHRLWAEHLEKEIKEIYL
jgi:hypothetical protein